jgi:CheY-like chemotaxis protein
MIEKTKVKSILVVEDSPEDYEVLLRAFKKAEILVPLFHACDAHDAMDFLLRRGIYSGEGTASQPALVLMDLNLPGMDGVALIRGIKADPPLSIIPLIVLTTSRSDLDVQTAYAAGANSYIPKPVDMAGYVRLAQMLKAYWFECAILP